jgi:hypothetical protein
MPMLVAADLAPVVQARPSRPQVGTPLATSPGRASARLRHTIELKGSQHSNIRGGETMRMRSPSGPLFKWYELAAVVAFGSVALLLAKLGLVI